MLETIFAGRCPSCGGACRIRMPLCARCFGKAEKLRDFCSVCGCPLSDGICRKCSGSSLEHADFVRAVYRYGGPVRDLLLSAKFSYGFREAFFVGAMISGADVPDGYDALVPVPSHYTRYFSRFFSPARIIASSLSRDTGIPVVRLLFRKRKTPFQCFLDASGRRENVREAFGCRPIGNSLRILLVDDILTTGSTMNECAAALKKRGASAVGCFALAAV